MGTIDFPSGRIHLTTGLSALTGLVPNDLSRVAFLLFFDIDGDGADDLGGEGRKLGGVAMYLLKNKIN